MGHELSISTPAADARAEQKQYFRAGSISVHVYALSKARVKVGSSSHALTRLTLALAGPGSLLASDFSCPHVHEAVRFAGLRDNAG